jgi:threonine aldolase
MNVVDLRSDTVTRPSPGMRRAMAEAEVGDDVFGDDPTVNRLQDQVAQLLGKEAALFVASGTMGNAVAVRAQTEPGQEIVLHRESHVYVYEAGGYAAISGCSVRLLDGAGGILDPEDVRRAIRPADEHQPPTRLIVLENTHNRGGGTIWPIERMAAVRAVAAEHGLRVHLDGARLMNACVATGVPATAYTCHADTVSICFSKGLGAPVGSALAGARETIARAHRVRKMLGGGMRQVGILAAAALYALEHNVDRLAEDHAHAARLAVGLANLPGVTIDPRAVATNIVYFEVDPGTGTAEWLCQALDAEGVWMLPLGAQKVRAVTHLDVSREGIEHALGVLARILKSRTR